MFATFYSDNWDYNGRQINTKTFYWHHGWVQLDWIEHTKISQHSEPIFFFVGDLWVSFSVLSNQPQIYSHKAKKKQRKLYLSLWTQSNLIFMLSWGGGGEGEGERTHKFYPMNLWNSLVVDFNHKQDDLVDVLDDCWSQSSITRRRKGVV